MSTTLYLLHTGLNNIGPGWCDMLAAPGHQTFWQLGSLYTVRNPPNGIQFTYIWSTTTLLNFVSGRAPADGFTFSSALARLWAQESATKANQANDGANVALRAMLFKRAPDGSLTLIAQGDNTQELDSQHIPGERDISLSFSPAFIAEDERLVLQVWGINAGSGGNVMKPDYYAELNGGWDASLYPSQVEIDADVAFKPES